MRRLLLPLLTSLCLLTIACAAPPTALPQGPPVIPWTHVSARGDTVAGRIFVAVQIDSVAPRIVAETIPVPVPDTVWCTPAGVCTRERPEVPTATIVPVVRGVLLGAMTGPPEGLGGGIYNAVLLSGPKAYAGLPEVRARGGKAVLYLARNPSRAWDPALRDSVLSVEAVKKFLDGWPDISSYVADGTIWGIMVADDITGKDIWGPGAPYLPEIDSLGLLVTQKWPGIRPIVRSPPTVLAKYRYQWRWVRWAWAQYAYRMGPVATYRDQNLAQAKALGLCLAFGLNTVNGGDGSSGIGTPPRSRMSAAEIVKYYSVFLPHTPIALHWEYRDEIDNAPDIKAAMRTVRAIADTTPAPSC